MLYHLLFPLRDSIAALNVVRYITFRAAFEKTFELPITPAQ